MKHWQQIIVALGVALFLAWYCAEQIDDQDYGELICMRTYSNGHCSDYAISHFSK